MVQEAVGKLREPNNCAITRTVGWFESKWLWNNCAITRTFCNQQPAIRNPQSTSAAPPPDYGMYLFLDPLYFSPNVCKNLEKSKMYIKLQMYLEIVRK